ncbi:hypothetical protein [Mesorhizobium sp. B2-6-4]|uniref:hypothetical protein n=1 Tax=Mesorhizobium sp. B2-6-4 TaxID=2589913 RepID=UPI0011269C91|nr:hypothetical protein [Mesorhizobium sp. B2-6-4]TPJ52432.1 hypothetical protein FJ426_17030 [Mesorhizobium sp. B2-6-4]
MLATHPDITRAAIEASFLLRHRSIAGTAAFRRNMDHTRKAIEASRELLKRLRQRQSENTARPWEDADQTAFAVSAFDADLLRSAFRDLALEMNLPECQWRDLAKSLALGYAGCEQIEVGLLDWIISK